MLAALERGQHIDGRVPRRGREMAIQGEYTIDAPREAVWRALNDTAVLQACIPGCESMTKNSDSEIDARISAQIGPIRSSFATHIVLSEIDPPSGYTLTAEGKGVAGFGRGTARVSLADLGGRTVLTYDAQMTIGGKLAQVGSRLVESATRSYSDQFFEAFAGQFPATAEAAAAPAPEADVSTAADMAAPAEQVPSRIGRWWLAAAGSAAIALGLWAAWR
jgi:carbon monoxide dehydrogenase subunit G